MKEETPYAIGAEVVGTDGTAGKLARVIVNPVTRTLTHLAVEPSHGTPRLVPVTQVGSQDHEQIRLTCSLAEFEGLQAAVETHLVPSDRDEFGYTADRVRWLPYYPLGPIGTMGTMGADIAAPMTYERVPAGEVQIRRGESVHALDGDIGSVQGLVIDASDNQVTHILLAEGHLWAKKDVAIPIKSVSEVADDGVHLLLTKDQVRDLPSVDIGRLD